MIPRDPLALQRQLAGLATLEATVRAALRALYVTYPTLARPQSDDEAVEITTARMLADSCNEVLVGSRTTAPTSRIASSCCSTPTRHLVRLEWLVSQQLGLGGFAHDDFEVGRARLRSWPAPPRFRCISKLLLRECDRSPGALRSA